MGFDCEAGADDGAEGLDVVGGEGGVEFLVEAEGRGRPGLEM